MANSDEDPGANTQMFRAYVDEGRGQGRAQGEGSSRSIAPFVVIGLVVIVLVVAAVVFFLR